MDEMEREVSDFIESIKYAYFKKIKKDIEYYSGKGDDAARLALGGLYNKLQGLIYAATHLDLSSPKAKTELRNLHAKFAHLKKTYYAITGQSITLFT